MADALGSVGVLLAAVLVLTTGRTGWDAILAAAIALFVAARAVMLGREVLVVLGQHAPAGMDIESVARDLEALPGVQDLHDMHVLTLTSGMDVATAHLVLDLDAPQDGVLAAAQRLLQDRYDITHATLQVEADPSKECHRASW
jgi:cobalt-zinc-cadmium efflux system protein